MEACPMSTPCVKLHRGTGGQSESDGIRPAEGGSLGGWRPGGVSRALGYFSGRLAVRLSDKKAKRQVIQTGKEEWSEKGVAARSSSCRTWLRKLE